MTISYVQQRPLYTFLNVFVMSFQQQIHDKIIVTYRMISLHSPNLNHLRRHHRHLPRQCSTDREFLHCLDNVLCVIVVNVVVRNRMNL